MTQRNGDSSPVKGSYYVAKYDYPQRGISAGQVFRGIEEVPPNIAVAWVSPS